MRKPVDHKRRSDKSVAELAGKYGAEEIGAALLSSDPRPLTVDERELLWDLFQQVGRRWNNVGRDSIFQRSSWLEFVTVKTLHTPSYVAEYVNAITVVDELVARHGLVEAYERLLLQHGLPDGSEKRPAVTRLDHAKVYVVDEFIKMQVVAGGFRGFGGQRRAYNYNGFVRGSRYNRVRRVRAFRPGEDRP